MILVVGRFRLPVERLPEAREALIRMIEATRAEPGCIAYCYADDVLEPGVIRVSERWETREALTAHFDTEHMKHWQRERIDFGMSDREMHAYRVDGEERL